MDRYLLTVACVLNVREKGRNEYNKSYVEKLRNMVARYLGPHRFVCLSNTEVPCERIPLIHDYPHWWAKMELFRPDIFPESDGRVLYFDLDTVIVGDLSDIAKVEHFTVIANWDGTPGHGNGSGMMMLTDRARVWDKWIQDPAKIIKKRSGDGAFIVPLSKHTWKNETPGQVVSFKKHVKRNETIPGDARVICFHGHPRPHELGSDHWMMEHWK